MLQGTTCKSPKFKNNLNIRLAFLYNIISPRSDEKKKLYDKKVQSKGKPTISTKSVALTKALCAARVSVQFGGCSFKFKSALLTLYNHVAGRYTGASKFDR